MPDEPMRTVAHKRRPAPFTWSWAWLWNWTYYRIPYEGDHTTDPLFSIFARRIPWMQTPAAMRHFHRHALLWGTGGTAVLLAIFSLLVVLIGDVVDVLGVLTLAIGVGVLVSVVVDFFCLYYAVEQVRYIRRAQLSDLLRMSTIFPSWLVESRYHLARVYAWRALYILLATRFAIMAMFVICAVGLVLAAAFSGEFSSYDLGGVTGYTLGATIFAGRFLLREPYWRYVAMVRIGTAIAVYRETLWGTWGWILMRLGGFWLLQGTFAMGWWFVSILVYALGAAQWYGVRVLAPFPGDFVIALVISMAVSAIPTVYLVVFKSSQMEFINDL
ncbi:MAG: hypothetical protein AAFR22_12805, partial [Chloroflexota bacterium]